MIRDLGDRLEVGGAMTLAQATALLAEGTGLMAQPEVVFDLASVTDVDSSGLAVLFGWLRAAKQQGRVVRITNAPRNLVSLAEVYGVGDLLPLA